MTPQIDGSRSAGGGVRVDHPGTVARLEGQVDRRLTTSATRNQNGCESE
jgi:hypothetical protein